MSTFHEWRRFGWHFHGNIQNLSDGADQGRPSVPTWRYGRGWLFFKNYDPDEQQTHLAKGTRIPGRLLFRRVIDGSFHAEWTVPDRHPGIGFTWGMSGMDEDWQISLGLGLFHLYFSVDGFRSIDSRYRKDKQGHYIDDMVTDIRFFDQGVWWQFWHSNSSWSNKTPRWRHGNWHPLDTLFGSTKHSSRLIRQATVDIPMPERSYPATINLTEDTWKRPRAWWTSARIRRAIIDVEGGIPHPGKGENSYDCDEDATYSLTTQARDEAEAIGAMVETVMRSRRKYGGANW